MKSLELSPRNLRGDFFLKIGILSVKVYTKKVPNIEECNFIHVPLRLLTTEQVIEVLYLKGVQLYGTVRMYDVNCNNFGHKHFKLIKVRS